MRKTLLIQIIFLFLVGVFTSKAQTTVFHETFDRLTAEVTTKALESGLTDESGYVVGSGGNAMVGTDNGSFLLVGGRFATKNVDLTGENVVLSVRFRFAGNTTNHKRLQIDIDKSGTSGMGGLYNEYNDSETAPKEFVTLTFDITNGTAGSYIHFRTESDGTAEIDEIKITKGKATTGINTSSLEKGAPISVDYYNTVGQKVNENYNGILIKRSTFADGSVETQKVCIQ